MQEAVEFKVFGTCWWANGAEIFGTVLQSMAEVAGAPPFIGRPTLGYVVCHVVGPQHHRPHCRMLT